MKRSHLLSATLSGLLFGPTLYWTPLRAGPKEPREVRYPGQHRAEQYEKRYTHDYSHYFAQRRRQSR